MPVINNINTRMKSTILPYLQRLGKMVYRQPIAAMIVLTVLTNFYLIVDYGVVNRSALSMLWEIGQGNTDNSSVSVFSQLIAGVHSVTGLSYVNSAYLLMIVAYTGIAVLLLLIARWLGFSLLAQWSLIFLLLSHPNFCDFRSYIIVEPLFWLLWIFALYLLLRLYKTHTIVAIVCWLVLFLCATRFSVAAWFWLLLFPFGALFWKPWRRKSVAYVLLGYAVIVGILLFLPIYEGTTPINWLQETIIANPQPLFDALRLKDNNWVKEDDILMSTVFVFSGAGSLILIRTMIGLSILCLILAVYSVLKKQYRIVNYDYLRIIIYAIIFDFMIAVTLLVLSADRSSVLSFSISLLLLLLSAQGLSYVFQKMAMGRYSRVSFLVIIWCLVAYFASGFIIFGPRKDYFREAGEYFSKNYAEQVLYSEDSLALFYANRNPAMRLDREDAEHVSEITDFYYAYSKNHHNELPPFWQSQKEVARFHNDRNDEVIIFHLGK